jgi:hypothetical protein
MIGNQYEKIGNIVKIGREYSAWREDSDNKNPVKKKQQTEIVKVTDKRNSREILRKLKL